MKRVSVAHSRELERAKRLRTPLARPQELLDLLKISSNYDTNYVLSSTALLEALAEIVVGECLEWKDDDNKNISGDDEGLNLILRSKIAWTKPPTLRMDRWLQHCATFEGLNDDTIRIMEAVAMILRNFSFTGANVTIMGYCPSILYSLVAFLVVGAKNPVYRRRQLGKINTTSTTEQESLCSSALQTLVHCVRHLDVTGQQLVADKLFNDMNLHDDDSFGQCLPGRIWGDSLGACWFARRLKDDTMEQSVPTSMVLSLSADYLIGVWTLFPALYEILSLSNRSVMLMALELLSEWIGLARVGLVGSVMPEDDTIRPRDNYPIPGLRAIMTQIPDVALEKLIQLLSMPRQGGDALEYVDPAKHAVARVAPLKLLATYDQAIDSDLRDRALEVLVPLMELDSPRMAIRVGKLCSFRGVILPILQTAVGRGDATLLGTQFLKELGQAEENQSQLLAIQPQLIELASSNLRVSRLVWGDLFPESKEEQGDDDAVMAGS